MAKLVVGAGHCKAGQTASGAYYNEWHESTINREVTNELIKLLRSKGHSVKNATIDKASSQNDCLKKVCNIVNADDYSMFIQIHCNMSKKHSASGCEVWEYSDSNNTISTNILKNLNKLGFKNRGKKFSKSLYVLKHTKPKALLVELFFMDSPVDRALYTKFGAKKIAEAIAKAVL